MGKLKIIKCNRFDKDCKMNELFLVLPAALASRVLSETYLICGLSGSQCFREVCFSAGVC